MRLADMSVQKLAVTKEKCACGKTHGGGSELYFCPNKRIGEILRERLVDYKALFVTDGEEKAALSRLIGENVMSAVLKEGDDATQLFAFPETVNLVVACGKSAARKARYFAALRGVRCAVICTSADAASLLETPVSVTACQRRAAYPAPPPGFIFFSSENVAADSLKEAYISLAAATLALFELRFRELVFHVPPSCAAVYALAYDVFLNVTGIGKSRDPAAALFGESYRWHYCLREGLDQTECGYLFGDCPDGEKFSAYEKALDLFSAFFRYGGRRKYVTADYFGRIRAAARMKRTSDFDISEHCYIPAPAEIGRYSDRFEECKARLALETEELKRRKQTILATYAAFGGVVKEGDESKKIYALPELSGCYGIVSLMRDFGLLERRQGIR